MRLFLGATTWGRKVAAVLVVCAVLSSSVVAEVMQGEISIYDLFDLETGSVCNRARCATRAFDFRFDINSGWLELIHIATDNRQIAIFDEQPFDVIGFADIGSATFSTDPVNFPLDPDDTVILQTDTGAYYKIGNAVLSFDPDIVNFDYELLAPPTSHLTLDKTSDTPNYSAVGDSINYSYEVVSDGDLFVTGPIMVSDDKVTVACPAVTMVGNNDDILDPGEMITCNALYTVKQADIDVGSITNMATASGDGGGVESVQRQVTVTWVPLPMILTLDKTANLQIYFNVGEVVNYSYLVRSAGTELVAGPITIDDDRETVSCPDVDTVGNEDANLDPNETITCIVSHTVVQADLDAGSITNTATASGDGGNLESNPDQWTVDYFYAIPVLELEKSADVLSYSLIGDVINYSYKVSNTGNRGTQGLFVVDSKVTVTCPELKTVGDHDSILDPGEMITCNASYEVMQTDIDAGSITNIAVAFTGVLSNEVELTITWVRSDIVFKSGFEPD